jgi:hypothetical protein
LLSVAHVGGYDRVGALKEKQVKVGKPKRVYRVEPIVDPLPRQKPQQRPTPTPAPKPRKVEPSTS